MGKVLNKNAATETLEKLELYWNPQQARAVIKFWAQFSESSKSNLCETTDVCLLKASF